MRLALIGVGLIGGSFAKALRATGKVERIVGLDVSASALREAAELGVIDESATSIAAAADSDVVVIAAPEGSIQETGGRSPPGSPSEPVRASSSIRRRSGMRWTYPRARSGHDSIGSSAKRSSALGSRWSTTSSTIRSARSSGGNRAFDGS